ncbi:MAG: DNA polymerase ligase N-terminal domain-containing protein [Planctomycetota bacterium]
MPQFAILRHDSPRGVHWDFFLEVGDALRTWSLPSPPAVGESMICESLGEHRLEYLDYQGPISGDRGHVIRWDRGSYQWLRDVADDVQVRLEGDWLRGKATLTRLPGSAQQWRFSFEE